MAEPRLCTNCGNRIVERHGTARLCFGCIYPSRSGGTELSPREREIAGLIASGLNNQEIAETLIISIQTVKNHITVIFKKLRCHSRVEIAVWHTNAHRATGGEII